MNPQWVAVQLARFRHKGPRQLHEDGNAKGLSSAMADKLGKLLLALETADNLEQVGRLPGWKLHPPRGETRRRIPPAIPT
jgi:toxin HigB-1